MKIEDKNTTNIPVEKLEYVRGATGFYAKNKKVTDYKKAIQEINEDDQIDLLEHLLFGHRI